LGGDCECLCTAISAYAQECNIRGASIKWRSQQLCRKCQDQKYCHCRSCYVTISHTSLVDPYDARGLQVSAVWVRLHVPPFQRHRSFYLKLCHHKHTKI
jgi:hypothetical protein